MRRSLPARPGAGRTAPAPVRVAVEHPAPRSVAEHERVRRSHGLSLNLRPARPTEATMDSSSNFPPSQEEPLSGDALGSEYLEVATSATPVRPQLPSEVASWASSFERAPEQAQLFLNFHR